MSWWWPFGSRADPAPVLYGYRLDRWTFLGTTEMTFTKEGEDKPWMKSIVAFFIHKEKLTRSFKVLGLDEVTYVRRQQILNHPFHVRAAEQWAVGEFALHSPIHQPSDYLRQYMRDEYKWRWNYGEERWEEAVEEQSEKKPAARLRKRPAQKSNVVVIDFTKPDKPAP